MSRVDEIQEQLEWKRQHAERFKIGALKAACDEIDYLLSLLKGGGAENCTYCDSSLGCAEHGDEDELQRLRREFELSGLGDRPSLMSASKLRRLIQMERSCATAPAETSEGHRQRNLEALDRFRDFKPNWDSYNGLPINQRAIEIAQRLVPALTEWQVVPRSDGMIQFDGPDGAEIQIEIDTGSSERCGECGHEGWLVGGVCQWKPGLETAFEEVCGHKCLSATEQAGEQVNATRAEVEEFRDALVGLGQRASTEQAGEQNAE